MRNGCLFRSGASVAHPMRKRILRVLLTESKTRKPPERLWKATAPGAPSIEMSQIWLELVGTAA